LTTAAFVPVGGKVPAASRESLVAIALTDIEDAGEERSTERGRPTPDQRADRQPGPLKQAWRIFEIGVSVVTAPAGSPRRR